MPPAVSAVRGRRRRWPLWRQCGLRPTACLPEGFTETIESLALEEDLGVALGQQGVEA
jgi:hypothetical protein